MTDFSQISALPAPETAPPALQSGTVVLYRDSDWASQSYTLNINDYREGVRQSLAGTSIQDQATWIAFNLPVGTVMTLTDNAADLDGYPVWNLRNCGRAVDLIGTGTTVGVDLTKCNMNDCISSFFWRSIQMQIGAIELFEDENFSGNRTVIFLDDWSFQTVNSIEDWYIADRASSARWRSLDSTIAASLFDNVDGSGSSYNNIMGWGGDKQLANFEDVGFNDRLSSFQWAGLIPMKEVIQPLKATVSVPTEDSFNLTTQVSGVNRSSLPVPVTLQLVNADAQTVTVSTTNSFTTGTKITATAGYSIGAADDGGAVSGSLSIEVNFSYTRTSQSTNSDTKTVTLAVTQQPSVPANSSYECTLIVQIGQLPLTTYTTQATRWYNEPVAGGVIDPLNNNWYKRTENITLTVAGGLACAVNVNVDATPLP